jgi:hypothetical protein
VTTPSPRVRRSAIYRSPVGRRVFGPARRGMPRWARRLLLMLPLLLLLLPLLLLGRQARLPSSLASSTLVGPRLVSGPICIEEAVDISGSLTSFAAQRNQAEDDLFAFARRELHKSDLFSEAFFAATGRLALPPSSLSGLSAPPSAPPGISPDATYLTPAVNALVAARSLAPPGDKCASRALVVITDGLIDDGQAQLTAALRKGNYTRIFAVIPAATGLGRPSELTGGIRNSITIYHFSSPGLSGEAASVFAGAKPLDVVLGDVIGTLTGQKLSRT